MHAYMAFHVTKLPHSLGAELTFECVLDAPGRSCEKAFRVVFLQIVRGLESGIPVEDSTYLLCVLLLRDLLIVFSLCGRLRVPCRTGNALDHLSQSR